MTDIPLELTPLLPPARLSDADATDFLAFAALNRRICEEHAGLPELAPDAEQLLADWHDQTDMLSTGFVARRGADIVGMVALDYPQEPEAESVEFDLLVANAHAGGGVEDALLDLVEREARRHERPLLQTWTLHRPIRAAHMLMPRSGWGELPATALTEVLAARGFLLEQTERNSELDLHADVGPLRAALAVAETAAGADYLASAWSAPTPPELRDGYAAILARLSTDAPSADMEFVAEIWDADRVARREHRLIEAGQTMSIAIVQYIPTGEIVAYNELSIGVDHNATTHQLGTLVSSEHRGHRLGMLVKCANLLRWRELMPTSPRVSTFNAEENRPMLDINESLGFTAVSAAGAWQKRI